MLRIIKCGQLFEPDRVLSVNRGEPAERSERSVMFGQSWKTKENVNGPRARRAPPAPLPRPPFGSHPLIPPTLPSAASTPSRPFSSLLAPSRPFSSPRYRQKVTGQFFSAEERNVRLEGTGITVAPPLYTGRVGTVDELLQLLDTKSA